MNTVHGKKANSIVLANDSHLDITPLPSKLNRDKMYARYLRRYNTYATMNSKKGVR